MMKIGAFYFLLELTSRIAEHAPLSTRAPVLNQVRAATEVGVVPRLLVQRAPVLVRPPQHIQVPSVRRHRADVLVPHAPVLMRPLQHLRWPPSAAAWHVLSSHGHPFSRNHCNTSR